MVSTSLPRDRVDYLPMIDRPIIEWPNGARVALCAEGRGQVLQSNILL
jgi:hypothetical protein